MAVAVNRLKNSSCPESVQYILDRLYTNRISIHMLICHYQALIGLTHSMDGMVGTIEPRYQKK